VQGSDRFKGASGTLGMNWWFTSKVDPGAVVLDMGGAVFMDQGQVADGKNS